MATELHVYDSAVWRQATSVHVNDGGTWRTIDEIYVNDGGTWRLVFDAVTLGASLPGSLTVADTQVSPSIAYATVTFLADGTYSTTGNGSDAGGTWITSGTAADFDIMFESISGTLNAGAGLADTWTNMASAVTWGNETAGGSLSFTGTIRIRPAGGGADLDSCPVSITAEAT
jgi:hypothetical protein